jgi:hypothetical protein
VFWTNIVLLIVVMVWIIAKVPFFIIALTIAINLAIIAFIYISVLPPQELAWERERRRQRYFPQGERKKKKRRR